MIMNKLKYYTKEAVDTIKWIAYDILILCIMLSWIWLVYGAYVTFEYVTK